MYCFFSLFLSQLELVAVVFPYFPWFYCCQCRRSHAFFFVCSCKYINALYYLRSKGGGAWTLNVCKFETNTHLRLACKISSHALVNYFLFPTLSYFQIGMLQVAPLTPSAITRVPSRNGNGFGKQSVTTASNISFGLLCKVDSLTGTTFLNIIFLLRTLANGVLHIGKTLHVLHHCTRAKSFWDTLHCPLLFTTRTMVSCHGFMVIYPLLLFTPQELHSGSSFRSLVMTSGAFVTNPYLIPTPLWQGTQLHSLAMSLEWVVYIHNKDKRQETDPNWMGNS